MRWIVAALNLNALNCHCAEMSALNCRALNWRGTSLLIQIIKYSNHLIIFKFTLLSETIPQSSIGDLYKPFIFLKRYCLSQLTQVLPIVFQCQCLNVWSSSGVVFLDLPLGRFMVKNCSSSSSIRLHSIKVCSLMPKKILIKYS